MKSPGGDDGNDCKLEEMKTGLRIRMAMTIVMEKG